MRTPPTWSSSSSSRGTATPIDFPYSRGTIRLTQAELREFFEEYIALLNRYKRPEAETPPGARTFLTRLLAFPARPPRAAQGTQGTPKRTATHTTEERPSAS